MLQVGGFVPSITFYATKTPADGDRKGGVNLSIKFRHLKKWREEQIVWRRDNRLTLEET